MSRELERIARDAMAAHGLESDFPPGARAQLARLGAPRSEGLRDLRELPWSSIDNDDSRDLDQLEVCVDEGGAGARVLIAIADVDALVPKDSPLDNHAAVNTTSVYTPAIIFPMLPPELSTDKTSLNQDVDRAAMVVDMTIDAAGTLTAADIYGALVRNKAQLTYDAIAAWLGKTGPAPAAFARVPGLDAQIRLQDAVADRLHDRRTAEGALEFERSELRPVVKGDEVTELRAEETNRARAVIENFMVTANGVTARFLSDRGFATIRRIVRSPERWSRIVDLAAERGASLPPAPDAKMLQQFLRTERAAAPETSRISRSASSNCWGAASTSRKARRSRAATSRSRPAATPTRRRRTGGFPTSRRSGC